MPAPLRGTGFCIFNLVSGVALLLARVIAGALWSAIGPAATFLVGAGLASLGLLARMAARPRCDMLGRKTGRQA